MWNQQPEKNAAYKQNCNHIKIVYSRLSEGAQDTFPVSTTIERTEGNTTVNFPVATFDPSATGASTSKMPDSSHFSHPSKLLHGNNTIRYQRNQIMPTRATQSVVVNFWVLLTKLPNHHLPQWLGGASWQVKGYCPRPKMHQQIIDLGPIASCSISYSMMVRYLWACEFFHMPDKRFSRFSRYVGGNVEHVMMVVPSLISAQHCNHETIFRIQNCWSFTSENMPTNWEVQQQILWCLLRRQD